MTDGYRPTLPPGFPAGVSPASDTHLPAGVPMWSGVHPPKREDVHALPCVHAMALEQMRVERDAARKESAEWEAKARRRLARAGRAIELARSFAIDAMKLRKVLTSEAPCETTKP